MFALEIVVNDKPSNEILLNPGNLKLPRPISSSIQYKYFGYIIAPDQDDAEEIFKETNKKGARMPPKKADVANVKYLINIRINYLLPKYSRICMMWMIMAKSWELPD